MLKLTSLIIICMLLANLYERNSKKELTNLGYRYVSKDKIFYVCIVVVLVLFSGLRIRYNDTATYIYSYNIMSGGISWIIGDNPAFQLINKIMKTARISANGFIMFYSLITVSIFLWFVRKYSSCFSLSIYILLTGGAYVFSLAAIKQCMAIAIGLLAVDAAIQKKWKKFIIYVFVAMLFHTYALMFAITPFLFFKPWTKKSYILIGIAMATGIMFQTALGTILNVTSLMGENYDISSFNGEGVNIFRLLVAVAPVVLSFIARKLTKKEEDNVACLMMNMTTINAAIMFVSLFGTAFYLARVANYFAIFPVVSIPYMLRYYTKESRIFLKIIIIIGFAGFAFYAYGLNRSFDAMYERISLIHFFHIFFAE